jgi:hypothetical protein
MTSADARALSDRMLEELLLRHVDPDLAAVLRAEARRPMDCPTGSWRRQHEQMRGLAMLRLRNSPCLPTAAGCPDAS